MKNRKIRTSQHGRQEPGPDVLDRHPPELSHGTARLAGIARAMAAEPGVLLLDEPASGLDTQERRELKDLVRRLLEAADRGIGVLIVEQHIHQALTIADKVYVLRQGRIQFAGSAAEARRNLPAIEASYLTGGDASQEASLG
jgi:branched-chain amino acid transport system ATP-binding protein